MQAAARFPGGFDWSYTVASALASQKHNPQGSHWFAGAVLLSLLLLWPALSLVRDQLHSTPSFLTRFGLGCLRMGLLSGMLVGLERLAFHHLSDLVHKAHEGLALLAFLSFYTGILSLLLNRIRRHKANLLIMIGVVAPLILIGITQFMLYVDQRDLGWVDAGWRELGIPVFLSFAFWQWWAMAFLWLGLGVVLLTGWKQKPG